MALPILQRKDGTVPADDEVRKVLRNAMSGKDRDEIAAIDPALKGCYAAA